MSRRTKFIIAAIFLVLLAVPAVYLTYTWQPYKPLILRLEHIAPMSEHDPLGYRDIRISVENTSPAVIYLVAILIEVPGKEPSWANPTGIVIEEYQSGGSVPTVPGAMIIGPHRRVQLEGELLPEHIRAAQRGDLLGHHYWESQPRRTWSGFLTWLHKHSPPLVQNSINSLRPITDVAPLESELEPSVPDSATPHASP
ncbi:hypothetical protein DES53_115131 [Roseimicrobium gellanilyticum]|uniref:Uncharacterized protein n=1 Tax=Roseimicrobium gellanilyticum TaxID=748857 RepID=A0A366H7M5_9BACT|nr:hypothetical protein [Roseimicrobium gellanilyticum]RBP36990.1 hypothetical protein DES53_115131 [Roseimicrobium gellanilyticum]